MRRIGKNKSRDSKIRERQWHRGKDGRQSWRECKKVESHGQCKLKLESRLGWSGGEGGAEDRSRRQTTLTHKSPKEKKKSSKSGCPWLHLTIQSNSDFCVTRQNKTHCFFHLNPTKKKKTFHFALWQQSLKVSQSSSSPAVCQSQNLGHWKTHPIWTQSAIHSCKTPLNLSGWSKLSNPSPAVK